MKSTIIIAMLTFSANCGSAQSLSLGIFGASGSGSTGNVSLDWSLGSISSIEEVYAALPVRLIFFKGMRTKTNTAQLSWETANETSNAGFEVQKSTDGKHFENIGWLDGKGDQGGLYQFFDDALITTSYYRLKQIDWDKRATLSKIVSVVPLNESVELAIAYPNPTVDGKIKLRLPTNTSQVILSDKGGMILSSSTQPTEHEIELALHQSGVHFIKIVTATETKTLRVVRP